MTPEEKYISLNRYLKELGSCSVAFSGGVDSTFLLAAAKEILNDNVLAITISSPFIPEWEVKEATGFCRQLNIDHLLLKVDLPEEIRNNSENRCYLCKKKIFSLILEESRKRNIFHVLDGSNKDDLNDFRPGRKALEEMKVKSPLMECGLYKDDIRILSKKMGLPTWDKPPYACLLSRIPYDTEIRDEELRRIEKSEVYLMSLGFRSVRVRNHGNLARIETGRDERSKLFSEAMLDQISRKLKEYGYNYVSFELEGYKTGNMNRQA